MGRHRSTSLAVVRLLRLATLVVVAAWVGIGAVTSNATSAIDRADAASQTEDPSELPQARPDHRTVAVGEIIDIDVLENDVNIPDECDGGDVSCDLTLLDEPRLGVAAIDNGPPRPHISYEAGHEVGDDEFDYRVCVGSGEIRDCSDATVTVTIRDQLPSSTTTSAPTTSSSPTSTSSTSNTSTSTSSTSTSSTTSTSQAPWRNTTSTTNVRTTTDAPDDIATTIAASDSTPEGTTTRSPIVELVLVDDLMWTAGEAITIEVLANDRLPAGAGHVGITIAAAPLHGDAEVTSDSAVRYVPADTFQGVDRFLYQACVADVCASAQITVQVRLECDIGHAVADHLEIEPSSGGVGDDVAIETSLRVEGFDLACAESAATVTLAGELWATVPLDLVDLTGGGIGGLSPGGNPAELALAGTAHTWVPDLPVGVHRVRLLAGQPPQVLVDTAFPVTAPAPGGLTPPAGENPEPRGSFPVVPVAIVTAVAVAAVPVLVKKRAYADPCPGQRRTARQADRAADKARSDLEAAWRRAESADVVLARSEADLAVCVGPSSPSGVVPAAIMLRGGGRAGVPEAEGLYLEQHPNPHAPERGELRGWFDLQRTAAIRGIVIHTGGVLPPTVTTAADAATEMAVMRRPFSVHAVVDATGVVPLLGDERAARHIPADDNDSLGVLVLGGGDGAIGHLAGWCAGKAAVHGFPLRRVDADRWRRGDGGLIAASELAAGTGATPDLDWNRLLSAAEGVAVPAVLPLVASPSRSGGCDKLRAARDRARREAEQARLAADAARERLASAESAQAAARQAVVDCECRHPAIQAPVTPAGHEQPDEGDSSAWFLLAHQNRSGGPRSNGRHGWYYPERSQPISGIVVHTAESLSAPGVAAYLSKVSRPASAHVVVDGAGTVNLLPDGATAFHAKGGNSRGLGIEIAYKAARWGSDSDYEQRLYQNAAAWCALKVLEYGIPVRRVDAAQWHAGTPGLVAHADLDPARRSDPGAGFQWEYFLDIIRWFMAGQVFHRESG